MKKNVCLLMAVSTVMTVAVSCKKAPQMQQTSWDTMVVEKGEFTLPVYFSAKITGLEDAKILPQVSGTIIAKHVAQGDHVEKGQPLFEIDPKPFALTVQQCNADLATAKAKLSSAKLNYESTQTLFDKGIVSRYVLETTQNDYASAEAALQVAESRLALAENDLNHCTIVSPVTGVVGTIEYHIGDLVSPNIVTPLTIVSDNRIAVASFSLNENQYTELLSYRAENFDGDIRNALSQIPEVELQLKSGKMYDKKGKIVSMSGVVDATTGAVVCKANFPNPEGLLASGTSGSVVFPSQFEDVMVIPSTAVNTMQDKSLAYVVQADSTVRCTVIKVESVSDGKQFIVTDGLNNGDKIVTIGVNRLVDGQKVMF